MHMPIDVFQSEDNFLFWISLLGLVFLRKRLFYLLLHTMYFSLLPAISHYYTPQKTFLMSIFAKTPGDP